MNMIFLNSQNNALLNRSKNISQLVRQAPPPTKTVVVETPAVREDDAEKKMKWGQATWFLFHTLAHKIKKEDFPSICKELLEVISMICNNLPCPTCAKHATEYIKKSRFFLIRSKDELKAFLFNFHNEINKKKGYAIYPFDNLDSKYENANTVAIIQTFVFFFQDKTGNVKMLSNDLHRLRMVTLLKTWFNSNITHFDS